MQFEVGDAYRTTEYRSGAYALIDKIIKDRVWVSWYDAAGVCLLPDDEFELEFLIQAFSGGKYKRLEIENFL